MKGLLQEQKSEHNFAQKSLKSQIQSMTTLKQQNANKIKVSFSGKVNILCFYVRLNFAIITDIVYSFTQFGFRF